MLPVVKQIHHDQASEVELQKKLHGKMSLLPHATFKVLFFLKIEFCGCISFIHYVTNFNIHLYLQGANYVLPGQN